MKQMSSSPPRLKGRSLNVLWCIIWNIQRQPKMGSVNEREAGLAVVIAPVMSCGYRHRRQWSRNHFEMMEAAEGAGERERGGRRREGTADVYSAAACIMCSSSSFACTLKVKHALSQSREQTPRQPCKGEAGRESAELSLSERSPEIGGGELPCLDFAMTMTKIKRHSAVVWSDRLPLSAS